LPDQHDRYIACSGFPLKNMMWRFKPPRLAIQARRPAHRRVVVLSSRAKGRRSAYSNVSAVRKLAMSKAVSIGGRVGMQGSQSALRIFILRSVHFVTQHVPARIFDLIGRQRSHPPHLPCTPQAGRLFACRYTSRVSCRRSPRSCFSRKDITASSFNSVLEICRLWSSTATR